MPLSSKKARFTYSFSSAMAKMGLVFGNVCFCFDLDHMIFQFGVPSLKFILLILEHLLHLYLTFRSTRLFIFRIGYRFFELHLLTASSPLLLFFLLLFLLKSLFQFFSFIRFFCCPFLSAYFTPQSHRTQKNTWKLL